MPWQRVWNWIRRLESVVGQGQVSFSEGARGPLVDTWAETWRDWGGCFVGTQGESIPGRGNGMWKEAQGGWCDQSPWGREKLQALEVREGWRNAVRLRRTLRDAVKPPAFCSGLYGVSWEQNSEGELTYRSKDPCLFCVHDRVGDKGTK